MTAGSCPGLNGEIDIKRTLLTATTTKTRTRIAVFVAVLSPVRSARGLVLVGGRVIAYATLLPLVEPRQRDAAPIKNLLNASLLRRCSSCNALRAALSGHNEGNRRICSDRTFAIRFIYRLKSRMAHKHWKAKAP